MLQPSKQLRQYFQYPSTELERLICNVEDIERELDELEDYLDDLRDGSQKLSSMDVTPATTTDMH